MSVPWMPHGYVDTSFSLNDTELERRVDNLNDNQQTADG